MFWGFLLVLFLVTAFAVTIILIEILSDERSFTFSKKRFYSKKLSFEEREKLEAIFRESFENILKNKQKVDLNKTLVERLETLEKTLYTKEYIQSLKDAISENSEHEQYLPTLEELAQNHNKSLKENNEKFDAVNNELLKANVTIFNDKKEEPLRILEQN
jgi:hemoglobin-like flavoprotein